MGFFSKGNSGAQATQPAGDVEIEGVGKVTVSRVIDCVGDSCPRPQLKTKKTLQEMGDGEVLELHVDNQSSMEIVPTMLAGFGARHLTTVRDGNMWKLYIRKGA